MKNEQALESALRRCVRYIETYGVEDDGELTVAARLALAEAKAALKVTRNTTRHRTHCDGCGRQIYTSAARPKCLCNTCKAKDDIAEISGTTCFHCGAPAVKATYYNEPRCERHIDD